MSDLKRMIWDLRGENMTVECARCGKQIGPELAVPEEGGEWECLPCNERCNAQEREQNTQSAAGGPSNG